MTGCSHLLYPGDRLPYVLPEQIKPRPTDLKIRVLNSSTNETLHAWHFATPQKKRNGLVVLFHGNGQNLTTHFFFFKWMTDYGYDFLIFDYRGYGASSGERASQQKTVEDGISVFDYIHKNFPEVPVVAIGQSLGSAVLGRTLQELKKSDRIDQLPQFVVFDSSFISYQAAARSTLSQRWFLYPLKPLTYFAIDDDWSPKSSLKDQPTIPALFFHNEGDRIIRIDLGREAYEAWLGPKFFIQDKSGGHTSAFADPRFVENRVTLIRCLDFVVNQKQNLDQCIKK
jgi:uncharacterized protein